MDTITSTTATIPLRVGVLAGNTRPTRRSPAIARWVADATHPDLSLDVVDLLDHDLPMLREPVAAAFGDYRHDETRAWAAVVDALDAVVLVTPEYNASLSAVLKNALDHLYAEWGGKPVGLVGYGMSGGLLAVEALRPVVAELRMIAAPTSPALSPHRVEDGTFRPADGDVEARDRMLDELALLGASTRRVGAPA